MPKESPDHPYVVLVGGHHTGKSSIVSRLSGIAPLATLCPIEWHFKFTSSETWSSCVSVSRWHTEGGQQALRAYKHQSLRVVCSNPQELHLLIMRAVILASSQAANGVASSNSLMTPEQVRNAYVKTISSSEHPCGVVHIYLELPHYRQDVSSPLTVVDLPGLSGQHIDYVKGLVKYYTKFSRNNRCIVAVVERGGVAQHEIYAIWFLKAIGINPRNVFLILTQTEDTMTAEDWFSISKGHSNANFHDLFVVFLPQELVRIPTTASSVGLNTDILRQQEAAYFQLHDAWTLRNIPSAKLGMANVIQGWNATWATRHRFGGNRPDYTCGPFTKITLVFIIVTFLSLCVGRNPV